MRAALTVIGASGSEALNVSRIVEGAGISRKAFYEYFDDVPQCIAEAYATAHLLIGEDMRSAVEVADQSVPFHKLRATISEFCAMAADEPVLTIAVVGSHFGSQSPLRDVWLEVGNAQRAIVSAYYDEERSRNLDLPKLSEARVNAAVAFISDSILRAAAEGEAGDLPARAYQLCDEMIAILAAQS